MANGPVNLDIGTVVDDKYRILERIGHGGMGTVFLARDLNTDLDVAVKVLSSGEENPDMHRRFRREFQMLSQLDHPRVVRTHAWGVMDARPYFSMAYLPGTTLAERLKENANTFHIADVLVLFHQLAEGLAYFHAQGMVHRDFKPSNIMVCEAAEGIESVILDLGLAKFRDIDKTSMTHSGTTMGTAEYMAPEQGKGLWVDHRADLYALGVVVYQLLTGEPPFSGQSPISVIFKHIRQQPEPPCTLNAEIPEPIQQVVLKLLEKELVDRFQSAEDLLVALEAIERGEDHNHLSSTRTDKPMRPQFLGREIELKALHRVLERGAVGKPEWVIISGEAGCGKTRLLEEIVGDARVNGMRVATGYCIEGQSPVSGPLNEIVEELVKNAPQNEQVVLNTQPEFRDIAGVLEGVDQPLMICIEDIQWVDEMTLSFLDYLLRYEGLQGVVICLTYRHSPHETPSPAVEGLIERIEARLGSHVKLDNLSKKEVQAVVGSMLGETEIPDGVTTALYEETGGHPLFVIETVRALYAEGLIYRDALQEWQWNTIPEGFMPNKLTGVLDKRLSVLPTHLRRVLDYACVFRHDFSFECLAHVWRGDELELLDSLEDLIDQDVLRRVEGEGDCFRFAHALLRRSMYHALSETRRRLLHREIGQATETLYAESIEDLVDELADHFLVAGENEKALSYLIRAGKKSYEFYAFGQSFERYDAAYALWENHNTPLPADVSAVDFLVDCAMAMEMGNVKELALPLLDRAYAMLSEDQLEQKARVLNYRGIALVTVYRPDEAEANQLEALNIIRQTGNAREEIRIMSGLGYLYDVSGRHEMASSYHRQIAEKYREIGGEENEAEALMSDARALICSFRFETGLKAYAEGLTALNAIGPKKVGFTYMLSRMYFFQGDFDRSEEIARETIRYWRKTGRAGSEASASVWLADLLLEQEAYGEALAQAEEALEAYKLTVRPSYIHRAYAIAAIASAKMGDVDSALAWAEKAKEGTEPKGGLFNGITPLVWCGVGYALAAAGRLEDADEAFVQAIASRKDAKGDPWARALLFIGKYYEDRGDLEKARTHLMRAVKEFETMEIPYLAGRAREILDRLTLASSLDVSPNEISQNRLLTLYEVSRELTSVLDLNTLLDHVLGHLLNACNSERAFIALSEMGAGQEIEVVRAHNLAEEASEMLSRSVVREVLATGKALVSLAAQQDDTLSRYQSVVDYEIRSVMCLPLYHAREGVVGALYVDHRGADHAFSESDQSFLTAFSNLVAIAVVNARMVTTLEERAAYLQQEVEARHTLGDLVGQSEPMQAVYRLLEQAADSEVPVLIKGETGTGKELAARAVHYGSTRKRSVFLSQNCGALSPELLQSELFGHKKGAFTGAVSDHAGLFEAADGGTVFLDEIGDASPQVQTSLLRVLQEGEIRRVGDMEPRKVNVRIVAASNRDLEAAIAEGAFREDLYYRLCVIQVEMPSLRERTEDIEVLASHLLERAAEAADKDVKGLTVGAMQVLMRHNWPGNVRELENEVRRAVAMCEAGGHIGPDLFSAAVWSEQVTEAYQGALKERVAEFEVHTIQMALARSDGNITEAANELGLSRNGLQKKMDRLGMVRPRGRRRQS